jgi:hypothetical protein
MRNLILLIFLSAIFWSMLISTLSSVLTDMTRRDCDLGIVAACKALQKP